MSSHLPSFETVHTTTPRDVLLAHDGAIQVPIVVDSAAVDGSNGDYTYEIRAGWLMGRVSATGRWVPCKRTLVNGSSSGSEANIDVDDAAAFKVGDVISVGADTGKTISAIDYADNVITVSSAFAFADGEAVVAQDGSQTARGILLDTVCLRNDDNTQAVSKSAGLLIQGAVQASMLLGDVAAIRSDTAAKLAGIRFSDDHV